MSCSSNVFATSNPAQGSHFYNTMSSWYTDVLGSRITYSGGRMIIGDIMTYFAEATNSNLNGIWGQLQSTTAFDIWHADRATAQPESLTQPLSLANLTGYIGSALTENTYKTFNRIDDIYNWLEDYENYQVWTILDDIAVSNSTISSRVNTTNSRLNTVNTNLNNILTAINNLVDYTQILNSIDGHVDQLEGYVDGLESTTSTISSRVNSTNTKLDTLIGHVDGLEGYTDGIENLLTTGNTNTGNIYNATDELESILNTFREEYNDIQFYSAGTYIGTFSDFGITPVTETGIIGNYACVGFTPPSAVKGIYRAILPLAITSGWANTDHYDVKITVSISGNSYETDTLLAWQFTSNGLEVYFYPKSRTNINRYIVVETKNDVIRYSSSIVPEFGYVRQNKKDFYEVFSYLYQFNASNILKDFKYLYADDNSLNAKKANQGQENSVLTNFTGSGSASASVSDYNDIASASSAVKNGLSSNASPSNVLGVFNGNDGFGWFSPATLNSLDSVGAGTRSFKSTNTSNSYPLLDENMDAILRYLVGGDDK